MNQKNELFKECLNNIEKLSPELKVFDIGDDGLLYSYIQTLLAVARTEYLQDSPQPRGIRWIKATIDNLPEETHLYIKWKLRDGEIIKDNVSREMLIDNLKRGMNIEYLLEEKEDSSPVVAEGNDWINVSVALPEVIIDNGKRKVKKVYVETETDLYQAYYFPKKFKLCEWEEFEIDNDADAERYKVETIDGELWLKEGWWSMYEHRGEWFETDIDKVIRWKPCYKPALQEEDVSSIGEGEETAEQLEKRTETNMNVIADFIEHLKEETDIIIPESALLSFFNA